MQEYFEMKKRKNGEIVRVYHIFENMATTFSPALYKSKGNGWERLKLTQLIPIDMPIENNEVISQTEKNKAKKRMKILNATWLTSDKEMWTHENIEKAIEHEVELMRNEQKREEE